MRPQVRLPLETGFEAARPEPSVGFLAGEDGVDPLARSLDNCFILQNIAKVAVSFEPIWQFLPAAVTLALRIGPGIAFELAPFRNLPDPARHALGFELHPLAQPAF